MLDKSELYSICRELAFANPPLRSCDIVQFVFLYLQRAFDRMEETEATWCNWKFPSRIFTDFIIFMRNNISIAHFSPRLFLFSSLSFYAARVPH